MIDGMNYTGLEGFETLGTIQDADGDTVAVYSPETGAVRFATYDQDVDAFAWIDDGRFRRYPTRERAVEAAKRAGF